MNLCNGFSLMDYARQRDYVLPAFNTTNLEMTIAIAKGLDAAGIPGYIQISSNNLRLSSPRVIAEIARFILKSCRTPIGLHRGQVKKGRYYNQGAYSNDSDDASNHGQRHSFPVFFLFFHQVYHVSLRFLLVISGGNLFPRKQIVDSNI